MSGGCSLSSPVILAQELSIAIFPQPLQRMAGNMVVGNSVGSCRLSGCCFPQFPEPVVIGQFSRAVENGKRAIPIPMEHHPHPDVMATVFVRRDLQLITIHADTVVGSDGSFLLLAKDVIQICPNPRNKR